MKHWLLTLVLCCTIVFSYAQDFSKSMRHAFLITRMMEKFHIQPAAVNDDFSNQLFYHFLRSADKEHLLFQAEDMDHLLAYRYKLDEEIVNQQTGFLRLVHQIREKRLKQNDSLLQIIFKTPFNFSLPEKISKADDSVYVKTLRDKQLKLYKYFKWQILDAITDEMPEQLSAALQKKFADSAAVVLSQTYRTVFQKMRSNATTDVLGNMFCSSIALCYDPHSTFFTAEEKESFDQELGQTPLRFGFNVDESEDGGVVIERLLPGSSAFKSGALNAGDKIIAIQEPGGNPNDVSEMSLTQMDSVMETITSDKLVFTIKKPDGKTREVTLFKERVEAEEDEDDLVQGYILKGPRNIGYISIPDFYVDWENTENGINGCANDVAKEVLKLTKEHIDGLIIDLRYNGGGSLQEAIDLSGIFIDGGPVGQLRLKDPKIHTLKDVNGGSVFTGPLLIMVNGYSASASEFFAAAMQDYNRALIVGAPTYGKATGQMVFPLDTTVTIETAGSKTGDAYIKITTSALFRITGSTAQKNGVVPDVLLNDLLQTVGEKERDEANSFTLAPIEPNKYYRPYPLIAKDKILNTTKTITDTSFFFRQIVAFDKWIKDARQNKELSLKLEDVLFNKQQETRFYTYFENYKSKNNYTVENHLLRQQRLQASELLTESDQETRILVSDDPYISLCYELLLRIINK